MQPPVSAVAIEIERLQLMPAPVEKRTYSAWLGAAGLGPMWPLWGWGELLLRVGGSPNRTIGNSPAAENSVILIQRRIIRTSAVGGGRTLAGRGDRV
jgi:hypothetical protein